MIKNRLFSAFLALTILASFVTDKCGISAGASEIPGVYTVADFTGEQKDAGVSGANAEQSNDFGYGGSTNSLKWIMKGEFQYFPDENINWKKYDAIHLRVCAQYPDQKFNLIFMGPETFTSGKYSQIVVSVTDEWQEITIPVSKINNCLNNSATGCGVGYILFNDNGWGNVGNYVKGSAIYIDSIWLTAPGYGADMNAPVPGIEDGAGDVAPDLGGSRTFELEFEQELWETDYSDAVSVFEVNGDNETLTEQEYEVSVNGNNLIVTFGSELLSPMEYKVSLASGKIISQNGAVLKDGFETYFSVGMGSRFFKIVNTQPADGSSSVDAHLPGFEYIINFNNELSAENDYSALISIEKNGVPADTEFSASAEGKSILISFSEALEGECSYEVFVDSSLEDIYGHTLSGDKSASFTTAADPLLIPEDGVVFSAGNEQDMKNIVKNGAAEIVTDNTFIFEQAAKITYKAGKDKHAYISYKTGDISKYTYVNYLFYNPKANEEKINLLIRSGDGTGYFRYSVKTDWEGWKVISLPLSGFSKDHSPSYTDIRSFSVNFNAWNNLRTENGYLILGRLWLTDRYEGAAVSVTGSEFENDAAYVPDNLGGDNAFSITVSNELINVFENKIAVSRFQNGEFTPADNYKTAIDGNTLKIVFDSGLTTGETYKISIPVDTLVSTNYTCNDEAVEYTFTVNAATPFFKVSSVSPGDGEYADAADGFEYKIIFNNKPDMSLYIPDYISVYMNGDKQLGIFSASANAETITLSFKNKLEANKTYTVKIDDGYSDEAGHAITGAKEFSFKTNSSQPGDSITIFSAGDSDDMNTAVAGGWVTSTTENANMYDKTAKISFTAGKDKTSFLSHDLIDARSMNYVNYRIYAPEGTSGTINLVFYTDLETNKYFMLKCSVDWQGWKLVSFPLSDASASLKNVCAVSMNFGGWSSPWAKSGYVLIDEAWFSKAAPTAPELDYTSFPDGYQNASVTGESITFVFKEQLADLQNPEVFVTNSADGTVVTDYEISLADKSVTILFGELTPGTEYKISINGLNSARYVTQTEPIIYTFKTADSGVFVSDLSFDCNKLETGAEAFASYSLVNYTGSGAYAVCRIVSYDENGIIVSEKSTEVTLGSGEARQVSLSETGSTGYIKAFVTDNDGNILSNKFITLKAESVNVSEGCITAGNGPSLSIDNVASDINILSVSGTAKGVLNTVTVTVTDENGSQVAFEPVSAGRNGGFSYCSAIPDECSSGVYTVEVRAGGAVALASFKYVSEKDRAEFLRLANGNSAEKLNEWIKANAKAIDYEKYSDESIADTAAIILECGTYTGYAEVCKMLELIPGTINMLNKCTWANMAQFLSDNKGIMFGKSDTEYKYFSGLSSKTQNSILMTSVAPKMPFGTIGGFRNVFDNAVKAYKNSPADSGTGGGSGGGGGGGSTANTGIVMTKSPQAPADTAELKTEIFTDLKGFEWAKDSIMTLYEQGVISPADNRCFRPSDNITREEFVKMIIEAFYKDFQAEAHSFTDEVSGAWYNSYISAAYELKIVTGHPDGSFGIGECITREDMVTISCRAVEALGKTISSQGTGEFSDFNAISDYAADYVSALSAAGVVSGMGDGSFSPKANANRAQAAKVIARLRELYK